MIEEDKMIRGLLAYARKHDCKGWREMHYKFTANELHQHYLAFFRELQVKNCSIPDVGRSLPSSEFVEGLSKEVLDRMHQNTTVVTNENERDIWDTAFILGYYGGLEGK